LDGRSEAAALFLESPRDETSVVTILDAIRGPWGSALGLCLVAAGLLGLLRPAFGWRTALARGSALSSWGVALLGSRARPLVGQGIPIGLALLAVGLVLIVLRAARKGSESGRGSVFALIVAVSFGIVVGPSAVHGLLESRHPRPEGALEESRTPLEFRKYNFRFTPPERPWVELDPRKMGDDSLVYLMRTDPPLFLTVRAELEDGNDPSKVETIAELAKGRLGSEARSFRVIQEEPYAVHGLSGLQMVAELDQGAGLLTRALWVFSRSGFIYEIATWGPSRRTTKEQVLEEAARGLSGFDMLDRERVASPSDEDAKEFHSALYGYDVSPPKGWAEWKDASREVPGAEYGIVSDDDASLVVVPVPLLGRDPDLPILTRSLLEQLDISYPSSTLSRCRSVSLGGLVGCDYDYEGLSEGVRSVYRFRVLKGRGCGYLLASWIPKRLAATKGRELEEAFRLVSFRVLTPPTLERLPPDDRMASGRIFNEMGLAYYEKERYDEALKAFHLAFELDQVDAVVLENVVQAYAALGRYREALEYLDRHIRGFPHATDLQEWRDYLKEQVDQDKEEAPGNKSAALQRPSKGAPFA
jgi:hypothetical protein